MASAPPHPSITSNLLTTQNALIHTLTSFLTVTLHQILYLRRIYPPVSFLSTRAYNYPVRQNRHPAVCQWVQSAVDAVRDQLEKGCVEKVAVCIFECANNEVLERWTFDLRAFPVVEARERDTPFERRGAGEEEDEEEEEEGGDDDDGADPPLKMKINLADLEAQFKAVLAKMSSAAAKLKPLSEDQECSFTVTIEVKEDADRPVGRVEKEERIWIAAEPKPWSNEHDDEHDDREQNPSKRQKTEGRTVPVRRLEAGELRMELWVEESTFKYGANQASHV